MKENKRVKAENLVVKEDTLTGKDLARKKILDQLANLEDRPWSTDSPVMKKLLREKELRPDLDVEKQGFVRKLFTKKN